MTSMLAIGRRLAMVVALLAMMHGLTHTHAIDALITDHSATGAQRCILCVTAQSSVSTPAPRIDPPISHDVAETALAAGVKTRVADHSLPSRAPPQA
jgi:hypothetical protein